MTPASSGSAPIGSGTVASITWGTDSTWSAANTTVVFPMRDLAAPNVSDLLDGLAIPDIGSARVIEDN